MNKTEYSNFIKQLIDNLYAVIVSHDAASDFAPILKQIQKSVAEKPEYIFAALNPKSAMNIKFPYILYAIFYALRNLDSKDILNNVSSQGINILANCVAESRNLGAPEYAELKMVDETFQKALAITNTLGRAWQNVMSVFDAWDYKIDAIHKKNQEKQRIRRRYNNNTVEIEELVAVLYPGTDKTIEQKIKKFWCAIERASKSKERASKSNPKVKPDNWFVTEDGVKKFCRRYYDKLCVFLGITKVPHASKVCTIKELAAKLYPNDAAARSSLIYRIQYVRTSAPLSFADYAKLASFFASGEGGILLFRNGHEQELLDFLDNIPQKPRKVVPENTLTFKELADLVFYDEADTDKRVGKLYSRKCAMARLTPKRKQEVESWFIQIWGGKCFKKAHYVEFFNLMRPDDTIPQEQLTLLGIKNYSKPQHGVVYRKPNNFVNAPEAIDGNLPFEELANILYPTLSSPLSYLHKRKHYLLKDYPEYAPKMDEWFIKGPKGKMWLCAEFYPQFKEFLSLPLKSSRQKSSSQMQKGISANFGGGMSGVKALEQYLQAVQDMMLEITQQRNEALARQKQHIKMALGTPGKPKNFKDIAEGVTAAQHEQIIIEDCDEQMAKLQQNADEATVLLQRARDAEKAWLEINAQIEDFLCQNKK